MSFDGGFGAVAFVRGNLARDIVKAAHFRNGDAFRVAIGRTLQLGGVEVTLSGVFFVEAPHVEFHAGDSGARVSLTGHARLQLASSLGRESCIARLTASLRVPLAFREVQENSYTTKVYLDFSAFDVLGATVTVPWISSLPGLHAPSLALDGEFLRLLVDAIRPMASDHLRINVPIDKLDQMQLNLFVQSMVSTPRVRPTAIKILDDAFAVGFDVFSGTERLTHGDTNGLTLPWNVFAQRISEQRKILGRPLPPTPDAAQVIIAVAPSLVLDYAARNLRYQMAVRPMAADKRVDALTLSLHSGFIKLHLYITKINPDPFPDVQVEVEVSLSSTRDLIGIVDTKTIFDPSGVLNSIGVGVVIGGYIRELVDSNVAMQVIGINWALSAVRFHGDVPGISGPPGRATVRITQEGIAFDSTYVLCGLEASVLNTGKYRHDGYVDDVDDLPMHYLTRPNLPRASFDRALPVPIRERAIELQVLEDHPTLRRDPTLRTHWTLKIRRHDGTSSVWEQDHWSDDPAARRLSLDLWSPELYFADYLDVELRYDRLPAVGEPLPTMNLRVQDRFRRDRKYVRWHREIIWRTGDEQNPSWGSKVRSSAIHKTDIRERCKFCDTGSNRPVGSSGMEHFDQLPAPAKPPFRTELCPYCFPSSG